MDSKLVLYNTLTRRKEVFEPLVPGRVGMYMGHSSLERTNDFFILSSSSSVIT